MSPVETDEPIAMLFGWQVRVGPLRKHVLYGGAIGTSWRIQMNDYCAAPMRPYVTLLRPLVIRYIR